MPKKTLTLKDDCVSLKIVLDDRCKNCLYYNFYAIKEQKPTDLIDFCIDCNKLVTVNEQGGLKNGTHDNVFKGLSQISRESR